MLAVVEGMCREASAAGCPAPGHLLPEGHLWEQQGAHNAALPAVHEEECLVDNTVSPPHSTSHRASLPCKDVHQLTGRQPFAPVWPGADDERCQAVQA